MELKITELLQTENKKVIVRAGGRGCGRCFQGVQHFNCGRWVNSGNLMYNEVTSVNKTVLYIWNLLKIKYSLSVLTSSKNKEKVTVR